MIDAINIQSYVEMTKWLRVLNKTYMYSSLIPTFKQSLALESNQGCSLDDDDDDQNGKCNHGQRGELEHHHAQQSLRLMKGVDQFLCVLIFIYFLFLFCIFLFSMFSFFLINKVNNSHSLSNCYIKTHALFLT